MTVPDVGASSPPATCSIVDLPDALGPLTATNSPGATVSDTPSSARTPAAPER
jgi:hypothetical protein